MDRRGFLGTTAGAAAGLTGCLGLFGGDSAPLGEHPASRNLDAQPVLGPDPSGAEAVLIAFEDPSCPSCRRFERGTVPEIRSKLVEPGTAAFVGRVFPVVFPWGEPATQALEAVHARDPAAFWTLQNHYFENQSRFDVGNVLHRTETFLETRTDLDAATVVADARNEAHGDAVRQDLRDGRDADVSGTPTVALFRDGEFVTLVAGPQDYEVYANALGVDP